MTKITAFLMALYMTFAGLFGVSVNAPDLQNGEMYQYEATDEQIELFREIYESETAFLATMHNHCSR